jgi:hypothetical protein
MENSIRGSMCKGLRACGIPKPQTHVILNTIEKWYDGSGKEWCNDRIKALRQWYESYLAGKPTPPDWFEHTKSNLPKGIWKWVFNLSPEKALGVLSLNTCLFESQLTPKQLDKFVSGLQEGPKASRAEFREFYEAILDRGCLRQFVPGYFRKAGIREPEAPTILDMNGACPVQYGQKSFRPESKLGPAEKVFEDTWMCVPQRTLDFIDDITGLHPDRWPERANSWLPEWFYGSTRSRLTRRNSFDPTFGVGRIGVIQEPELKARIVANPNRVVQVTLDPLRDLYLDICSRIPSACIHNQDEGVEWVRKHLEMGHTIDGFDLSSASDKLDLDLCLDLIDYCFDLRTDFSYTLYEDYFRDISRMSWYFPQQDRYVRWEQGDPLGTGPSIGILTLANVCAAYIAVSLDYYRAHCLEYDKLSDAILWTAVEGHPRFDSFRIIGDDVAMLHTSVPDYIGVIKDLGGSINLTKTLSSNQVAEFAGRVILPDRALMKRIPYKNPSDYSFMSYMSALGDSAKYFLKPHQREMYEKFKYIPGYVVEGPWIRDSYGISLTLRYQWYLEVVQPVLQQEDPDLIKVDYEQVLLRALFSRLEKIPNSSRIGDVSKDILSLANKEGIINLELLCPRGDDFPSSSVTPTFRSGGDPRRYRMKTLLEVLKQASNDHRFIPFDEWLAKHPESYNDYSLSDVEKVPCHLDSEGILILDDPDYFPGNISDTICDSDEELGGPEL